MGNVTGPIKQAFVDLPQGQIHYRHAGDGPPLLLLHPTSFSSEAYLEIMPILAARFRVIAMDRFGHGGSDPPPEGVTVEDLATAVVDFLDALGVGLTSILGGHTGSYEAIEVAASHPQRVNKLVLMGGPNWSEEERSKILSQQAMVPKMDGSHMMDMWRWRRELVGPSTAPELLNREVVATLLSLSNSMQIRHSMVRHYIDKKLPMVQAPTLFLCGEQSYNVLHVGHHRSLMSPTTPVETAVIKDTGNSAAMEKPEEFARILMDFLAKP